MLTAKNTANSTPKLEDGVYTAICSGLIDMGMQPNDKYKKSTQKVRIIWSIVGETIKLADGTEINRTFSKEYTNSLSDRSTLKRDLQSWRGKPFTDEELQGFDLTKILNTACQLQIINQKSDNGKEYTNIQTVMACPKGMKVEPLDATMVFDFDDETSWVNYLTQPQFIKDRIKLAENYKDSELEKWVLNNDTVDDTNKDNVDVDTF